MNVCTYSRVDTDSWEYLDSLAAQETESMSQGVGVGVIM
jgi:hypothetical protein